MYNIIHKPNYNWIDIGAILGAFNKIVRFTKPENFGPKGGGGGLGIRAILILKT